MVLDVLRRSRKVLEEVCGWRRRSIRSLVWVREVDPGIPALVEGEDGVIAVKAPADGLHLKPEHGVALSDLTGKFVCQP